MQNAVKVFLLGIGVILGTTGVNALEMRFDKPMYKNLARLDNCQHMGNFCGQPAANDFCDMKGYERASKFETERATPTRVMNFGQECKGSVCVAFKYIVCLTRAQAPGKARDWPHTID